MNPEVRWSFNVCSWKSQKSSPIRWHPPSEDRKPKIFRTTSKGYRNYPRSALVILWFFIQKVKISSNKVDPAEKNMNPGEPQTRPLSIQRLRIHHIRPMSIHRLWIHNTRPWPSESTTLEWESKFRSHKKTWPTEKFFQRNVFSHLTTPTWTYNPVLGQGAFSENSVDRDERFSWLKGRKNTNNLLHWKMRFPLRPYYSSRQKTFRVNEVASSEHSGSTRTNRWGISKSPRTPQPQLQRRKW